MGDVPILSLMLGLGYKAEEEAFWSNNQEP